MTSHSVCCESLGGVDKGLHDPSTKAVWDLIVQTASGGPKLSSLPSTVALTMGSLRKKSQGQILAPSISGEKA